MAIIQDSDLQTFLSISDGIDATAVGWATAAANQAVQDFCGRSFDHTAPESASARVYRPKDQCRLPVDDFWETSALDIRVDLADNGSFSQVWDPSDFLLEPYNGLVGDTPHPYTAILSIGFKLFPVWNRRPSVQVTAAWGWESVPPAVFQGTLHEAAHLFSRKDSPNGIVGSTDVGVIRVSRIQDPDAERLLRPYKRPELAVQIA